MICEACEDQEGYEWAYGIIRCIGCWDNLVSEAAADYFGLKEVVMYPGAVKVEATYRCRWCRREEKITVFDHPIDGAANRHRETPAGWRGSVVQARAIDICSGDCEKEFAQAFSQAVALALQVRRDEFREGLRGPQREGEAPYDFDLRDQMLEQLRKQAMREREEKFL